jgi:ATP/maltotriose-dependent transcriptional regulator MalT
VPGFDITRREAEILHLLDAGEGYDAIAAQLAIPATGVGWHIERTLAKLGAATPAEAVSRYRSLQGVSTTLTASREASAS